MPWHQEPMKDVGICDKPGGVDNRTVIPGCPNGETPSETFFVIWRPVPEHIGCVGGTRGSETSQYPQEEKTRVIPLVVASERGSG